jgi:hypothetical protein
MAIALTLAGMPWLGQMNNRAVNAQNAMTATATAIPNRPERVLCRDVRHAPRPNRAVPTSAGTWLSLRGVAHWLAGGS